MTSSFLSLLLLLIVFSKNTPIATTKNHKPTQKKPYLLNLRLTHRETDQKNTLARDFQRIEALQARTDKNKGRTPRTGTRRTLAEDEVKLMMGTLKSGASMGSGEYFMDVFIGTPPVHFSMILDTGSDLNWVQCTPCTACFRQNGPLYDPSLSSSARNITCGDPRCSAVARPAGRPCLRPGQTCPYFYWYGDSSNTTGDLSLDTFTLNTTSGGGAASVVLGCGRANMGLFHGAGGLLGLGRGPLSFPSQLRPLFGRSFSYCLVGRTASPETSSALLFGRGDDLRLPQMNFTAFSPEAGDTFYYLRIKSVTVGGETLGIDERVWGPAGDGAILDSGTTLSYFPGPAFAEIEAAFVRRTEGVRMVEGFPLLHPCYNITGVVNPGFPGLEIGFRDGGVWRFPPGNCFIEIVEGEVACLAMLATPHSDMTIIGNYQQQNFQVVYDNERARLGFAPADCAGAALRPAV